MSMAWHKQTTSLTLAFINTITTAAVGGGEEGATTEGKALDRKRSAELFDSFNDNSVGEQDLNVAVKDPKKLC